MALTNGGSARSLWYYDQSPTNALATGQSQTLTLEGGERAAQGHFRCGRPWCGPTRLGNPAAGVKLVNDLDLVITQPGHRGRVLRE